jgi:acyl-CoA thioesterase-1
MAYEPAAPLFKLRRRLPGRGAAAVLACLTLVLALADPTPARATQKLLVIGDSITAGYGLPADQAFPVKLEAALRKRGHDIEVINGGISGDTTAGGRARLAWALHARPDFVIIELGGNDGLRGIDPADTRANLDAMLTALKKAKIPVLLTGMMAPRNLGPDYAKAFDAIFPALAKKHDVMLYPFFLDGIALDPRYNQADLIHPNPKGVDIVVRRILPAVEKLIGKAGK